MAAASIWARSSTYAYIGRRTASALLYVPFAILFNDHVAELTRIEGQSMYPFFNSEGDRTTRMDVCVNFKIDAQENLARGMVVTFRSPSKPEVQSVKRVIGLEGDVVRTRQPYPFEFVKVPAGHIWVEGDGGEGKSKDSNSYGPVSARLVTGRLTSIVWPLHKFGKIRWWEHRSDAVVRRGEL